MSHGDEVYDIIEESDKQTVRSELLQNVAPQGKSARKACLDSEQSGDENDDNCCGQSQSSSPSLAGNFSSVSQQSNEEQVLDKEPRIALCRMNVSRNARRQMRFGDQKVVLVEGRYCGTLPLSSRKEPVFVATCRPIAMPETTDRVVQGDTNIFKTMHSMDMRILHADAK